MYVSKKGENETNEALLKRLNDNGRIYLVPAKLRNQFVLRFVICSRYTESEDVIYAWQEICSQADQLKSEDSALNSTIKVKF